MYQMGRNRFEPKLLLRAKDLALRMTQYDLMMTS